MKTYQVLQSVSNRLRSGSTLVEAFEATGEDRLVEAARRGDGLLEIFEIQGAEPHLLEALKAVQDSNDVPLALNRLAELELQTETTRESVFQALVYPRILLLTMLAMFALVLIGVVGPLQKLYMQMNIHVAAPTKMLFFAHSLFTHPFGIVLIALATFGISALFSRRSGLESVRDLVPFVGPWKRRLDTISYFIWLDSGIRDGLALPDASERAISACLSPAFQTQLKDATLRLTRGDTLSQALEPCSRMPKETLSLVKIAERKELTNGSLRKISDFLNRELKRSTEKSISMIEPAAVTVIGLALSLLVGATILPLKDVLNSL